MPRSLRANRVGVMVSMNRNKALVMRSARVWAGAAAILVSAGAAIAQRTAAPRDPAEPSKAATAPRSAARPTGAIVRSTVDEKGMRALISKLVACGTRLTIASWDDPKRGPGCARDVV